MKKIIFLFLFIFTGMVFSISAQDNEMENEEEDIDFENEDELYYDFFNFGINVDLQYINSSDINNYIADQLSGYSVTGSTNLFLLIETGINFRIRPLKFFGVRMGGEAYIAPKIVRGDVAGSFFLYGGSLYAVGVFYIPFRKASILFGAGPEFHLTTFEEYFGCGLGFRGEVGVDFCNKEISILVRVAHIKDKDDSNFDMSLTGVGLRVGFFF